MAFGVVAEPCDKILATKILVTSTFQEFNDNLDTAKSLCGKYLHRMNELPAVIQTCKVVFTPVKSFSDKLSSISGNSKRDDILEGVAELNKCVHDYFEKMNTELSMKPVIRFQPYHIDPVADLLLNRKAKQIIELERCNCGFISVAMTSRNIFAALGKTTSESVENNIMAIDLENYQLRHLIGHAAAVLSVCCNEDLLCSGSYDQKVIIWNAKTFELVKELTGHTGSVRTVCISDSFIYSGSTDCSVRVWDYHDDNYACVKTFELPYYVTKVACSKRAFLFVLSGLRTVQIWHAQKFTLLHSLEACEQAYDIIANDARLFIATKGVQGHAIQCWNLGSLTELAILPYSGANMAKYYNSPYLICGEGDKLKMVSTTSQRLVVEKEIVVGDGRCFVGKQIRYVWMDGVVLYVLALGEKGRACIVRY